MKKIYFNICTVILTALLISSCSNELEKIEEITSFTETSEKQNSTESNQKRFFLSKVNSYEGVINTNIKSSTFNYPKFSFKRKLPVVIILHGYFSNKNRLKWTAEELAKRGFITLAITGKNYLNPFTNPKDWVKNYEAAFTNIKAENQRKNSPLYRRFDFRKVNIMGHSMGGGGAFYFADQTSEKIKSIVGLAPASFAIKKPGSKTTVPTLVMAGGKDILSTKRMTNKIFETIASKNKEYAFFEKAKHTDFEFYIKNYPEIYKKLFSWLEKNGK